MTVSLPPLPEGWRDDVVYMLHDFLEDAGLAQTLCALEQETGYAPARHPPTRTAPQIHLSDSNFPTRHAPTRRPVLTRHLIRHVSGTEVPPRIDSATTSRSSAGSY